MDQWASWFAQRRHGGDVQQLARTLEFLAPIRDDVLGHAEIADGDTVLDVGCGDGLIGLASAELVGTQGCVIFSDVSDDLLDQCRQHAAKIGLTDRCRFVRASASDLAGIADQTVDAVTLRSVLIYEPDKPTAFQEFHRVLRPGGRLSLFEPINRFGHPREFGQFNGYDAGSAPDLAARVTAFYAQIQPWATDPMFNFDERSLIEAADRAGFAQVRLELRASIEAPPPSGWEAFLHSSGNPRIPTIAEAFEQALTRPEIDRLTVALRASVEHGIGRRRSAHAFLWATRGPTR